MSRVQIFASVLAVAALAGVGFVLLSDQNKPEQPDRQVAGYAPTLDLSENTSSPAAGNPTKASNAPIQKPAATAPPPSAASPDTPVEEAETNTLPRIKGSLTWGQVEEGFQTLRAAMKDHAQAANDLHQLYFLVSRPAFTGSQDYPSHCAELGKWRDEFPESPTPLVALAAAHRKWAWEARGGGAAFTVTEDGWRLFHSRIDESRRMAEQAIELGAQDAEPYSELIVVGMATGASKEELRKLFDAGFKISPHHLGMYLNLAIALMPRWGGEPGDVERFANEIPTLVAGDDGLSLFAQVAEEIHIYEHNDPVTILWGQYDRKLSGPAAAVFARRFSHVQSAVQFAALMAMVAQDHAAAREIRPLVGKFNPNHKIFNWEPTHKLFLDWSAADEVPASGERHLWAALAGCSGLALGKDSKHVWVGHQYGARGASLFDFELGQNVLEVPHPGGTVNLVVFDEGQKLIAFSTIHRTQLGWIVFDLNAPQRPIHFGTDEKVRSMAIHPRERQIAWTEGNLLRRLVLDDSDQKPQDVVLKGPADIAYSTSGEWLIVNQGGDYQIFDAATGKLHLAMPSANQKPRPATSCREVFDLDEEGRIWALTADFKSGQQSLVRYAAEAKSAETLITGLFGHTSDIKLSPNRRWLARTKVTGNPRGQELIEIYDVGAGSLRQTLPGHWNSIRRLVFSPDSERLASIANMSDVVKVWSLDALEPASEPAAERSAAGE
jgi:hypothetical protein